MEQRRRRRRRRARAAAAKAVRSRTGAPTGTSREPRSAARGGGAGSSGGGSGGSDAGAAGPALGDGVDGLPGDEGDEATRRGESGGEKQRSDIADDGERETTSAWSSHTRNEHSSSMYGVDVQLAAAAEEDEDAAPEEEADAAHVAHALARWPQLIVRAQPLGALPRSYPNETSSSGASCTWMTGSGDFPGERGGERGGGDGATAALIGVTTALPELSIDTNLKRSDGGGGDGGVAEHGRSSVSNWSGVYGFGAPSTWSAVEVDGSRHGQLLWRNRVKKMDGSQARWQHN